MDREKEFKRKRLFSFLITLGYVFFGGFEYVSILPTLWNYLQTVGVTEEYWLGFCVSSNPDFAAAIAGIIGGRLTDKYNDHTKMFVISSIIFRAAGNFLYFFASNVFHILCARLMCGIGTAAGTALMAEVCRTTTMKERTSYLSMVMSCFHFGILFGPALQLLLSYFQFTILGFEVNPLNAPGLFIGLVWLFYWVATMFLFTNLTAEFRNLEVLRRTISKRPEDEGESGDSSSGTSSSESLSNEKKKVRTEGGPTFKQYVDEFLTDSYVLLMSISFNIYFCQMGIETVIPVITEDNFDFSIYENTYIYMLGGLIALICYGLCSTSFVTSRVRESTFQITGWALMLSGLVWLMLTMPHYEKGNKTHIVYFFIGIVVFYMGSPISVVGNTALSSKVLSNETQGLGQGIRRLIIYVGLIFGPSWAGSTVKLPYLFLGVMILVMLINSVMLGVSYKKLRQAEDRMVEPSQTRKKNADANDLVVDQDESTPLLRSNVASE